MTGCAAESPRLPVRRSTWRKLLRTGAVLACVTLVVVGPGWAVPGASSPRQAEPSTTSDDDAAILDLVGCLEDAERLSVVLLIDESGSLQTTDPEDRRVDAAIAAIDGLALLVNEESDQELRIDLLMAAFSNEFRPIRGWTALLPENDEVLRSSLRSFADLDDGTDTDLVNALNGARAALAARSTELTRRDEPEPCQAVLVFTDGEYNISPRTPDNIDVLGPSKEYAPDIVIDSPEAAAEAMEAGREALCREGGLADQIRGDDIVLLSIALSGDPSGADQELLAAATRGEAGSTVCGRPTSSPPGAFVVATSTDVLITRFDEITTRVAGGTRVPGGDGIVACGEDPCAEGTRSVTADASVNRLRILAFAPAPGIVVEVEGPGGTATIDSPGTTRAGDVELVSRGVVDRGFTITAERPDAGDDWEGTWEVRVLSPDGSLAGEPVTLEIYVFSDIGIRLDDDVQLTRGTSTEFSAELVLPEGLDGAELLAEASAVLRLADPLGEGVLTVDLDGPPAGPFTGTVLVPPEYRTSYYRASVELRATSRQGAEIVARSPSTDLMVLRPEGSIQFSPMSVEFPTITGDGTSTADLVLTGGPAPGCVWFSPALGTVPDGAGKITVTHDGREVVSEDDCIPVPADGNVTVALEAGPDRRATGVALGAIVVHERTDATEATVTTVPYRLDLEAGIDEARRMVLAVLLLAAGLALPAVLLLVINSVTAQFQALDAVRAASIPVKVQGNDIYRTEGGRIRPFAFADEDFTSLEGTGSTREFVFGGVEFRARASKNPFGPMVALAAPEGGAEKLKGGAGRKVELDAGLAGSWVLLIDPDRTVAARAGVAEGNLIAFVTTGAFEPQAARMTEDLRRRLPGTASSLARLVRGKVKG